MDVADSDIVEVTEIQILGAEPSLTAAIGEDEDAREALEKLLPHRGRTLVLGAIGVLALAGIGVLVARAIRA